MGDPSATPALPVLDLSRPDGGAAAADDVRRDLREAAHRTGLFSLVGHGVPDDAVADVFAVAARFFALPEADELAIEMTRSPHFRGFTRAGGELTQGQVDWREQVDLATGVTQDPADPVSGRYGDDLLEARLRAHPDVAARHHPDLVGRRSGATA